MPIPVALMAAVVTITTVQVITIATTAARQARQIQDLRVLVVRAIRALLTTHQVAPVIASPREEAYSHPETSLSYQVLLIAVIARRKMLIRCQNLQPHRDLCRLYGRLYRSATGIPCA